MSLASSSVSGRGRESGDSVSSGALQTPSTTLSLPSMPDIFVWAPADENSKFRGRPQCAFDSSDPYFDFGISQDPPTKLQIPVERQEGMQQEFEFEHGDEPYDDVEEEEIEQVKIIPRKSTVDYTGNEPIAFTRESLLQQSPPGPLPPPLPEKPKKLKTRATSFFKSFGRSTKKSNNDLSTEVMARRATSQDLPSSERDTLRKKRSILFSLSRKNKSTTSLSRLSTESDLSLDPDPFSSAPPVPPIPAKYEVHKRKSVVQPILRRQGTEPMSLRSRANETSPPLPPIPTFNESDSSSVGSTIFKSSSFVESTPPMLDYFDSQDDFSTTLKLDDMSPSTSGDSDARVKPNAHQKLPSLHFESLHFDIASF